MGVGFGLVLSPFTLVFLTHFVFKIFEAGSKPISGGGFPSPLCAIIIVIDDSGTRMPGAGSASKLPLN